MGRVHIEPVSLVELVRRAGLVVLTAPGRPTERRHRLALAERDPEGRRIPAFQHVTWRFVVAEVLAGADAIRLDGRPLGLRAGDGIEVRRAGFHRALDLHVAYEARGESRSYVAEVFETDVELERSEGPLVLFLQHHQRDDALEFACAGAYLDGRRRREVLRLLGRRPR